MNLIYNIHYGVAAALFAIILLLYMRLMYGVRSKSSKAFQGLILVLLVCDVLDVITAITISYHAQIPWMLNMFLNTMFFFSTMMLGYAFLGYAKQYTYKDFAPKLLGIIGEVFLALYVVMLIVNWFTGWMFVIDPVTGYQHGAWYNASYIVPFFYVVAAMILFFKSYREITLSSRIALCLYILIGITGPVLQATVFPDVLLTQFTIILGLLMIMFTVESPDYDKLMATMKELEETKALAESAMNQAQEANQAKSDFLASMSHELRTPINVVLGMNEMIMRESKEESTLNYAKDIDNSSQMLLNLVNDILDFSKIEAGKMQIVSVKYQMDSLLHDLYVMTKSRAEKKELGLRFDIDPNTPNVLKGDEVRIRQIALNLLSNAVKYTDKGHITLTLESRRTALDKVEINLAVHDTGRGIRPEDQNALFNSFTRVDEAKNRNIEGTGLGLAITKNLVEMMGGEISVNSLYGAGSVFRVKFAQEIIDDKPIGRFEQRIEAVENTTSYRRTFVAPEASVLVVDDVAMNLRVFSNLLKETEIQIDTAESGKRALELIAQKKYHLIFLDHMMPEMDGMECMDRIKKMIENPNYDTPVVMLTANAIVGVREEYLNAGFCDYMSKPFKGKDLEKLIMTYIPENLITMGDVKGDSKVVLHVGKGLEFCGGNEVLYHQVLRDYVEEDRSEALHGYWEAEDWVNYRVQIHAIKSTSQTIGALHLYEVAKELEEAVKDGNYEFVKEHHEGVLREYRELIDQIRQNEVDWDALN
ncbi:MAG: response regulator [Lachnospiraceae bacterium]|nr:response regulator [Lachnospiraceae bacterium]